MPRFGEWIEGDDVEVQLSGTSAGYAWERTPSPGIPFIDALDGTFGESYDEYPASTLVAGSRLATYALGVDHYIAYASTRDTTLERIELDPGSWPTGAIGIEFEPEGEGTGDVYYGSYSVDTSYMLDAAQSSGIYSIDTRLLSRDTSLWAVTNPPTSADFPTRTKFLSWTTRRAGSSTVGTIPIGATPVSWTQTSGYVAVMAVAESMWTNTPFTGADVHFYVTTPVVSRMYTPPRHRFIYPSGAPSVRQRQTLDATVGGWPLRQRQNGGATGTWPLRQRGNN